MHAKNWCFTVITVPHVHFKRLHKVAIMLHKTCVINQGKKAMLRNTAPAAPAPNTGPGYW